MPNLSELWQSAEDLMIKAEYEQAIKILEEIQSFSYQLRTEQLIELKQSFIEAYINNGQHQKAIQLCQSLINTNKSELKTWAKTKLEIINPCSDQEINREFDNLSKEISFKTVYEFKTFAQDNLLDILKQFEQKRKTAIISIMLGTIIFIVAIYFISKGLNLLHDIPNCLSSSNKNLTNITYSGYRICHNLFNLKLALLTRLAIAFLGSTMIWLAFIQGTIYFYSNGFKSKVIEKILDFIDTEKRFVYQNQIYAAQLLYSDLPLINISVSESELFHNSFSGIAEYIKQEDCVIGKINNIKTFWSQIHVQKASGYDLLGVVNNLDNLVRQLGIDNFLFKILAKIFLFPLKIIIILLLPVIYFGLIQNARIRQILQFNFCWGRKNIFQGLFFAANFPKRLKGKTLVTTRNLKNNLKTKIQHQYNIVDLEDVEFNNIFLVSSNDQIEARYVLSTNLMSKLVDFHKKVKKPLKISFIEDKIYIAIAYNYCIFEPKLFKSMIRFAPLKEYFETLNFMMTIVQDLNLNRKIWG